MQQHSGKDTAETRKEELAEYKKTNGEVEVGASGHDVTTDEQCDVGMLHKAANVAIAKALEEMKAAITIWLYPSKSQYEVPKC